jgi:hypothetical protein
MTGKPFVIRKLDFEDLNRERRNTLTDREKLFIERKEEALKDYLGAKMANSKAKQVRFSKAFHAGGKLAKIPYKPVYVEKDCIFYPQFQRPLTTPFPIMAPELWKEVIRLMKDVRSVWLMAGLTKSFLTLVYKLPKEISGRNVIIY